MSRAEQTVAFCSALLGDLSERRGLTSTVWVSSPTGKATRWVSATPEAVVEAVREADAGTPGANTFLSMGVANVRLAANRRMGLNDVVGLTSVWAEIDIAGPAHVAHNLPTTVADARRVLDSCGLPPSLIWHSGHGLQAAWLLDEPWIFTDAENVALDRTHARDLVREWRASIAVHAHTMGAWRVDPVHDISRVLRVPGTINRKIDDEGNALDETECVLLESDPNRRYSPDDLRAHMVDRHQMEAFSGRRLEGLSKAAAVGQHAVWNLCLTYGPHFTPEWLTDAMEYDARLAKVWREGAGGDSETDASLARRIADYGGDEALAVEAIFCYRLKTGRKVDKVDPNRRTDYVERTVDFAFSQAAAAHEARESATAERDAVLAAQNSASRNGSSALSTMERPIDHRVLDPPNDDGPRVADVARHVLDSTTDVVVPDGHFSSPAPPADIDPREPEPETPPIAEHDDDIPDDDVEIPDHVTASLTTPRPRPVRDELEVARERDNDPDGEGDGTGEPLVPPPNPWGERTESQVSELTALSEMLFGAQPGPNQVWRLYQRGRGATAQRRIQMRMGRDHVYIGPTPEGYRPGYPLNSGWWPAGTFDGLNGWQRVFRQDLRLRTLNVAAQAFNARFPDTLVPFWEPDDSGGSVGSVIATALVQYLLDHPPTQQWSEAASTGTPLITQGAPPWDPSREFSVDVRWAEVCRFVRVHHALNVTPPVAAEMEEIARVSPVSTREQDGRWRRVDPDYLTLRQWRAVLDAGRTAEEGRQTKRLRLLGGGAS